MRYSPVFAAAAIAVVLYFVLPKPGGSAEQHAADDSPAIARAILQQAGDRGGLCVHVGAGDGRLTAALGAAMNGLVHGLEREPANVAAAREYIQSLGRYGTVSVFCWNNRNLPYADNLVNLLVIDGRVSLDKDEILRVLSPGGTALVVSEDGRRTADKIVKPWPAEMDDWSHWDGGPDGNPVSQDELVGPPREVQWLAGPRYSKQHWGPRVGAAVTAGGRLFTVEDETPTSTFNIADRWMLIARDAFNGIELWRRELPEWASGVWDASRRNPEAQRLADEFSWGVFSSGTGGRGPESMQTMVATGDRLFVPLGARQPVTMLDAATGEVLRTFSDTPSPKKTVFADGLLLVGDDRQVCAVEPETGGVRWRVEGSYPSAKDGRVYLLTDRRQGLACLDLQTGDSVWASDGNQAARPGPFDGPLQVGAGILLGPSSINRKTTWLAFSLEDGRPLWQTDHSAGPFASGGGPFLLRDRIWILKTREGVVQTLDPRTGRLLDEIDAPAIRFVGHHARCYYSRATCRFIIGKERGADFVDLASGEVAWHNWVRGPCRRGVIPANGLLYAGQHSCRCYSESAVRGLYALAPDRGSAAAKSEADARLAQGPAYEAIRELPDSESHSADWPTYRHDPARSGGTLTPLPDRLSEKWATPLDGPLTAPVVAQGAVFVAASDRHTLYALDAESGRVRWTFTAGARIDSPPTIERGLAVLGCRDGYVYCLRAEDGVLAWRFRAAPADRLVGAHGQLESAWPVSGSVLVKDGVVYAVAGRNSFLDGGLTLCGLDLATGRLRYERSIQGPWPGPETGTSRETPNPGFTMPGTSSDVLAADGDALYLRELRMDASLGEMEDQQPNFYRDPGGEGEGGGGDVKYWDNLPHAERHAVMDDPAFLHRGFFNHFPGRRLYTTTGMLDGDWHRRMYWAYGQIVGQYLVFRDDMGYAVRVFEANSREGGFNSGEGYAVLAGRTADRELPGQKLYALPTDQTAWRFRVPFRPQAMVLAGEHLLLAGPLDDSDPRDALASLDGRRGGVLWIVTAAEGRPVAQWPLDCPPIHDGLAVARNRLYWSGTDGRIRCYAKPTE
ncbi:MAG: PQQ-binding-like beta-propeller repeat protein [Pirellulaceae bacterium]|nr:PQQ-binding-like beta-propeller repeat protein [Pirellulaceae bacterium]